MKIVIADASCLITLDNVNEPDLLPKLSEQVFVTPEVAVEVGDSLPGWVIQKSSLNRTLVDRLCTELEIGEATSIALALEIPECILIIDEKRGRRRAEQLGIEITGTLGILLTGIENGLIKEPESLAARLESVGFRLSERLIALLDPRIH